MNSELESLPAEIVDHCLLRIASDLSLMAWEQMLAWRPLLGARLDANVVDTKTSPNDLVTRADAQIEALVRGYLNQVRPHDLMVGEEGSEALDPVAFFPADFLLGLNAFDPETGALNEIADDGPRLEWHIDPIDGTVNYVRSIEHHAFSVGVCAVADEKDAGLGLGDWQIGLVASPGLDATWLAAAGLGAFRIDGRLADHRETGAAIPARRLRGTPPGLSGRLLATGFAYALSNRGVQLSKLENLMTGYDDIRRCGSAALDLCMVAEGRVNGYAERGLGIYDYAGGAVIVEEAGLKVSRGGSGGPTAAADTQDEVDRLIAAI
ncbi:inositol monophosphatase family protein [Brevibacterium linens]|uniref:Myo-inositol-1(Or 4)-monophosphatase n=1 Tax=Brevibacterium linens ATCC 9172 TaxID=1255617 RepID=A0A2H1J6X0_BRELN|nr:inositol monophosphatase family protein [Brevibacterium linens]KAB1948671.1 inositol-phosphate phosphatase [Brevibacterium linens ATCC 9172]SMX83179.1 myo-inositol-1(or 4)-monophosphatase [Brevibacterium linens ATCC 9172]